MIRYVLGVILVASMMTVSMNALGGTVVRNADNHVETELDTLETEANSLRYNEETVPDTVQESTRELTLSFPQDSLISTDIDEVEFDPDPKTGTTTVSYDIRGETKREILEVPLVDPAYDSFSLEGAKDLDLQLRLDRDTEGRKVIVVERKSETIIRPGAFLIRQVEDNGPVRSGSTIEFDVTIEHTGDVRDERTVEVSIDEYGTRSRDVTIEPGEQTTETFTFSTVRGESGAYTATIETRHDGTKQDETTQTVQVVSRGNFDIEIVDTDEKEIDGDRHCTLDPCIGTERPELLAVTARLDNRRGVETTRTVDFAVDGLPEDDSASVTAGDGQSARETFYIDTEDVQLQDYDVTVSTGEASDTKTVTVLGSEFVTDIGDLSVDVDDGELDVPLTIENTGQLEDTQQIDVTLIDPNGNTRDTVNTEVQLRGGGRSATPTLHIPLQPRYPEGEYTVRASSDDTTDTGSISITSEFDVEITSMSATTTGGTEQIEIMAEVDNTGVLQGSQTVTLTVDDQNGRSVAGSPQSRPVSLRPSDRPREIPFTIPHQPETTEYDATVTSDDDTATDTLSTKPEFTVDITDASKNCQWMWVNWQWSCEATAFIDVTNNGILTSRQPIDVEAIGTSESASREVFVTVAPGETDFISPQIDTESWEANEVEASTEENYADDKGNSDTEPVP